MIPIVFGVNEDPVKLGLVANLARPEGNATGVNFFTAEVAAKRLDLLHELVPGAARIAVLVNPNNNTSTEATLRDATAAARAIGLQMRIFNARTGGEINTAFDAIEHEPPDAVFVAGDAYFSSRRVQLVNLASRHAIPTTFSQREFTGAG